MGGHALNTASVTALLGRMERSGRVQRDRDSTDRRRVVHRVTPAAEKHGHMPMGPTLSHGENFC